MANSTLMKEEPCPVARCVNLIGDRWSLLIVRDAFDGMRRFGDFQRSLGVARNILSDRLKSWWMLVFLKCKMLQMVRLIRNMC